MFSSAIRILTLGVVAVLGASTLAHAQLATNPTQAIEEANDDDNGLPFRGSNFSFSQSLAGNSFLRSTDLSYNPTYSWGFGLNLFWHFNRRLSLSLNQELAVELTDSDSTLTRREPVLSDTVLGLNALLTRQKFSSEFEWTLNGTGNLIAPTSQASQAATLVVGARLGVTGTAVFSKIMNGLAGSVSLSYLQRFLRSNLAEPSEPYPCAAGATSQTLCNQVGGRSNTRFGFNVGVSGSLSLSDKWDVSLSLSHAWRRGADLADWTFTSDDGKRLALRDGSLSHWRNATTLTAGVGYAVLQWLGLGLSATNSFAERGIDGQYRAPFHATDTFLGLDISVRLDEIYLAARGRSH